MDGSAPDWKGLLKWSIAHSDGTQAPRQLSEEDKRFFAEAMRDQTVDVVKRMKEISMIMNLSPEVLAAQDITAEEIEGMLEELQEHVESIDMANDLHALGGLMPLLNYLKNPNAGIRARAAEVVSTIVQNNPKSQQQVMDCNGLDKLLVTFNSDEDVKVRTKALGAISSLIRHNKVATDAFRLSNGYVGLREVLALGDRRLQRKSLQVLQYLLQENPEDFTVATQVGFAASLISLVSSADQDVRQSALRAWIEVVRHNDSRGAGKFHDTDQLRHAVSIRLEEMKSLAPEDQAGMKEEQKLVNILWQLLQK